MLRLAADENFDNDIVRGVQCRNPDVDIVCVQDVGLSGADDATILDWAAQAGRVLTLWTQSGRLRASVSMLKGQRQHREEPGKGTVADGIWRFGALVGLLPWTLPPDMV